MYYLGLEQFDKEKCKRYKTLEGAMKAAAKDEKLIVWDENGKIIDLLSDSNIQTLNDNCTHPEQEEAIISHGKMRVTVICDGSLNIRRSPEWSDDNICGRAIRGQTYYAKEIRIVDGKKMVKTVGNLYLSGDPAHVQIESI